jgi:hypothetical protein
MGTTLSGLPYPEPTDPVAQGAAAIKALATFLDPYPRGQLARTVSAGQDVTGTASILTTTCTVPAGASRRLRVHVNLQGQQITTAAVTTNATIYGNGTSGTRILFGAIALNDSVIVAGWSDFLAPAGMFTAYLSVSVNAGAFRVAASPLTHLTIEDLGKQY